MAGCEVTGHPNSAGEALEMAHAQEPDVALLDTFYDTIDILEIALEVSKKYKLHLKADDKNNAEIFSSLRTLARYVIERQATT